jgi:uncharacterized protein (DUF305 family)
VSSVLQPDIDQPLPPDLGTEAGDDGEGDGVAPWWHSPWKLLVMGLALAFLGAAGAYAVMARADRPPHAGSVDVGFLQDMRLHHDNAVGLAYAYLSLPADGQDPTLRLVAGEILLGQQLENGRMVQMLRDWGQEEANTTGQVMGWMGMALPADRMPGLATRDQLESMVAEPGPDADRLFAELMIAHHEGGIHMAETAAAEAGEAKVRSLARSMAAAQQDELTQLTRWT